MPAVDTRLVGQSLASLEGLRFLSSLLIVAAHYIPYVSATPLIARLHLAVDLFFVISGLVIADRYAGRINDVRDWLRFINRRIARLYPLHLLTLGFYIAIGVLVWSGKLHPTDATRYNVAEILPNLLLMQAWRLDAPISFNYVSWSISAEFFVYLAFPLIFAALRSRRLAGLAGIALGLILFAWIAQTEVGRPLTRLDWRGGVLRALPSFAFGVWLSCHLASLVRAGAMMRNLLHLLLVVLVVAMLARANEYALLMLVWSIVALAYACDRAGLSTWVSARWLAARGELTYSIYMLHTVVATIVIAVLGPRLFGTTPGARLAAVVVAVPVLLLLARASLRWFEAPLRQRIGTWGDRLLARPAIATG